MAFHITKESAEQYVKADDRFKEICPRCGGELGKYPALSRYADIDICSNCGTEEAMCGFVGIKNDFTDWKLGRD